MTRDELDHLKANFDVIAYLDDQDVFYETGGDNVGEGWIGVECFFCGMDHKNHLGVNLDSKNFHCWICEETGDILKLIMALEDIPFPMVQERLLDYQEVGASYQKPQEPTQRREREPDQPILPKFCDPIRPGNEPPLVLKYFERRGFPLSWCEKYDLRFCLPHGEYPLHLIVPIYLNGDIVSYQAHDMTGKASRKYEHCPNSRAAVPNSGLLYNLDNITDQVILVEGVTDVWRIGDGAVGMLGKKWTWKKLSLLKGKAAGLRIKVLLDADALAQAENLAWMLEGYNVFESVEVIPLEAGDPAELTDDEIRNVLER